MDVLAAVAREPGQPFAIERVELSPPAPDEVLVRIVGVGICHTDLSARDGRTPMPLPAVLGHEGAGVVEQVGAAVTDLAPGDHVVLTFGSCGQCRNCLAGRPSYCVEFGRRTVSGLRPDGSPTLRCGCGALHGGFFAQSSFASHALAKARNAVKIRKDVPLELMGPLGCGVQTGAGAVINVLKPGPADVLAVFGAGSVGLSAVMAGRLAGCARIVAVDISTSRLALARELGADETLDGRDGDVAARLRELTGGRGIDHAVDTTGNPDVIEAAFAALAIPGALCLLGLTGEDRRASFGVNALMRGRRVLGSMEGDSDPQTFIPQLVDHWAAGRFPFDRMVSFHDFDTINDAVAAARDGRAVKAILRMGRENREGHDAGID
jgi:aryl-alcohol dehydrogenase